MALRINTNVAQIKATRNLDNSTSRLTKSLARLSTGLRINSAADGAAALMISEKQKAQIAGLAQAMENTDRAISLVQTAEGAFAEINNLLVNIRNKALDSKNAGIYSADELSKNQAEVDKALDAIDRIVSTTQFGSKKLLDGTVGNTIQIYDGSDSLDLSFKDSQLATSTSNIVTVAVNTQASATILGGSGLGVGVNATPAVTGIGPATATLEVTQASAGAAISGGAVNGANSTYDTDTNAVFSIKVDGGVATAVTVTAVSTNGNASLADLLTDVNSALATASVDGLVEAVANDAGTGVQLVTKDEGSTATLELTAADAIATAQLGLAVTAVTAGTDTIIKLNGNANTFTDVQSDGSTTNQTLSDGNGGSFKIDLAATGTTTGVTTVEITGASGTMSIGGTAANFTVGSWAEVSNAVGESVKILVGNDVSSSGGSEQLTVTNNSLTFQIGANAGQSVQVSIESMAMSNVGKGVTNNSGFTSLAEIDVTDADKANDAINVIDQAINDVLDARGALGAFQANMLESTFNSLSVAHQNLQAANSVVVDTDFTVEIAEFTRMQILSQAGTSVLANAGQISQMALSLLQ